MAAPTIRGVSATRGSGTTSAVIPAVASIAAGDLLVMLIESSDSTTAAGTPNTPSGWTSSFEQTMGAGATDVTTLTIFTKIAAGGEGNVTVDGVLNHISGAMIAITTGTHGVSNLATDLVIGTVNQTTGTTGNSTNSITVTADSLILWCFGLTDDAADTTNVNAFTNSNLASLTKQWDETFLTGAGGGTSLVTGTCAGTTTGAGTWTHDNAVNAQSVYIGVKPVTVTNASVTPTTVSRTVAMTAPSVVATSPDASVTPTTVARAVVIPTPTVVATGALLNEFVGSDAVALTSGSGGNTGSGGAYFDVVNTSGAGDVLEFDTALYHSGTSSVRMVSASTGNEYLEWTSSWNDTTSTVYVRAYIYVTTGVASAANKFIRLFDSNGAEVAFMGFDVNPRLRIGDSAGTFTEATVGTFATGAWYRVEMEVPIGNSVTITGRIFSGANLDGTTPTEEWTQAASDTSVTAGNIASIRLGNSIAGPTINLDDVGISLGTWLGPRTLATNASVTPTTVSRAVAMTAPTVAATADRTPTTVAGIAAVPTPTVAAVRNPDITTTTVAGIAAVPTPTVAAVRNASVTPTTVAATTSVPTPTTSATADRTPTTVAGVAAVPTPTVSVLGNASVTPTTVGVIASVPSPTVAAVRNPDITTTTVAAIASVPTPSVATGAGEVTVVGVGATSTPTQASPHSIPYPSGGAAPATGDVILAVIECGLGTISAGWTGPAGWTEIVRKSQSAATGNTILSVHARISDGTETGNESFTVTNSSTVNHVAGQMMTIRGANVSTVGDIIVGTAVSGAASGSSPQTTSAITGITVSSGSLVLIIGSTALDASSTSQFGSWTNTDLSGITEWMDFVHLTGNGGGFGVASGTATTSPVTTATFQEATNEAWNGVQLGFPAGGAANANVTPASVSVAFAVPTPTVAAVRNQDITPTTLPIAASVPTPTADAVRNPSITTTPVALSVAMFAPTESASASVTPNTVAVAVSIPAPTVLPATLPTPGTSNGMVYVPTPVVTADAARAPPTVLTLAAAPTPTVSVTQNPSVTTVTVAASSSVPTPSVSTVTNADVTPATVARAVGVFTPTVDAVRNVSITPNTVAALTSVPTPTAASTAAVTPTTVSRAVAIPTPTVVSTAAITPNSVSATTSIPTPVTAANIAVTPTTVAAVTSIPTTSVVGTAAITPTPVARSVVIPTPTVDAVRNPSVTPTTVAAVTSIPTPVVATDQNASVTTTTVVSSVSVPTAVVTTTANVTTTTVPAVTSVLTPTATSTAAVTPATVSRIVAIPTPTVDAVRNVSITTSVVSAPASVPSVTVSAIRNVDITPTSVAATTAIPTPSVAVVRNPSVTPATTTAFASVPQPTGVATSAVTTTTVPAVASVPQASAAGTTSVTTSPVAAVTTTPTPVVAAPAALTTTSVARAVSIPTVSVTTEGNASVETATVSALTSVPQPTVDVIRNVSITLTPVAVSAAVPGASTVTANAAPLGPPPNITVTPVSATELFVDWDPLPGAVSYDIERDGVLVEAGHVATDFSDSGLIPSTTYKYRVRGNI